MIMLAVAAVLCVIGGIVSLADRRLIAHEMFNDNVPAKVIDNKIRKMKGDAVLYFVVGGVFLVLFVIFLHRVFFLD